MSRLRNITIPARGSVIAIIAALILLSGPCWGAAGLDDLAGPLREIALKAEHGAAIPHMGPMSVGDQVLVVVQFKSPVAAAANSLTSLGATVRFRHGSRVEAFVPADRLLEVASLPQVAQVRPPNFPIPLQGYGGTVSQGVALVGAVPFYASGITGDGVTVAIIDEGFAGFEDAEIPVNPDDSNDIVSFRAGGGMGGSAHGTAVAEIVADMAPGAEIVLIAVDTEMSVESAIDHVINRSIEVACMSMGLLGGPYDGTHPVSQKVNDARDRGVFWVSAAGNDAQRHYQGNWQDRDRDGRHEFTMGDEAIELNLSAGTYRAYLSWYETAGNQTDRDYDLVLRDATGNEIARSGFTQNGDDPPADTLIAQIPMEGTYSLGIDYVSGPDQHDDAFQLFSVGADLESGNRVAASSLNIPAEAQGSFTVGATRGAVIEDTDVPGVPIDGLEPFSSQGPVVGHPERTKPELVAPDGVRTSLVDQGYSPFLGTSAAAPHVAGAAALLLAEDQLRTPDDLAGVLQAQAVRIEEPVPNNRTGYGRLNMRVGADGRPPTITIAYPQNGTRITTRTPTVVAFITDDGSGVAPKSITIELNGAIVFDGDDVDNVYEYFDERTGRLAFTIQEALARTNHNIVINASDGVGNEAEPAVTNFRVAAPTFPGGVSMVSFPYRDLAVTDPSVILGIPLSELALVRWWPLDDGMDKYAYYPNVRASLVPPDCQQADIDDRTVPYPPAGLGYFLSIPRESVLDIQGQPLQEPSSHIRLYRGQFPPQGWNIIGNPYPDPVNWGSVQFEVDGRRLNLEAAIDEEITEGVLFEFVQGVGDQPGFYDFNPDPVSANLEPSVGYWIHVNEDVRVIVYNSNVGGASSPPRRADEAETADGWTLTLSARAGDFRDPRTIIGVMSDASAGYDPQWDIPKPPPLVDGLQVSMRRPGWGAHAGSYARDVRGPGDDAQWEIDVSSSLPDAEVALTWPNLNAEVPDDTRLILEDLETGRTTYMRTSNGYRFRTGPDGGVRHLRVSVQDAGGALAVQSMSAQPAGGGAAITYSVSEASDVSVEIMNIAGRPVKRFPGRAVDGASQQTLVWNGVSDRGSVVPSGRYIVRLTALAADGQTVRAIRPFSMTR